MQNHEQDTRAGLLAEIEDGNFQGTSKELALAIFEKKCAFC